VHGLVIGLGSIGRRHARNWARLALGPLAVARQIGAAQPEPLGVEVAEYHNIDDALERERPDIVLVTNPTILHVETACKALRAGAHVLVEKPLGGSLDGVRELLETARDRERKLVVGYNLRLHPGLARLKTLVDGNAIGKIVSARAECGEYLPDWHPWEDYRGGYSARRDLGGGAVLTFSHELDALCWLLGAPRRVTAMARHFSSLDIDTDDVAEIVLEFERGAVGSVHVDYVRRAPRRSIELIGEDGVLRWEFERNRLEEYRGVTRQWRIEQGDAAFERNQMYLDELRQFAASVRGQVGEGVLADGEQGAAVLAIALGALQAAGDGRTKDFRDSDETVRGWLGRLGDAALAAG
jgi:predicted dehydrogenase